MDIKPYTLGELSKHIGAELKGDPDCLISSPAPLDVASSGQISFLHDLKYKKHLPTTEASAIIVRPEDQAETKANLLLHKNPYLGFVKIVNLMIVYPKPTPGIHSTAVIGENCNIAKTAKIAANVVIGDNVRIGENTAILANTNIGDDVNVGDDTCINPNTTLYEGVRIGNRVLIHSGVVIGADGFGMLNDNGKWIKVPQVASVLIGDDVEIGANTTIDRGAFVDTVIEEGVKLDNQIQIGHNVHVGAHTAIAGCTCVAGSTHIGKHCMIGGDVTISGHLKLADQVILTGGTNVGSSITEPGVYSSGMIAQPTRDWKRNIICFMKLNDMKRRIKNLEKSRT